jgi:hypothetical protein
MKPDRWRLVYGPKRIARGPWRKSREGAITDAIDRGLAVRDEYDADKLFWDPLAEIEEGRERT